MTELDLLKQSIDVLTTDAALARETAEQWRCAYLNEVARTDKLVQQIILLTTPKSDPKKTYPMPAQEPEADTALPSQVMRAISARAHLAPRHELVEWAETQLANGDNADAVADTILIGAMRSEDTDEVGFEGADEEANGD